MLDLGRDQRNNEGQQERDGQRGRDGQQTSRPARQDASAQRRDAKEEAAEDISDPDERIECWRAPRFTPLTGPEALLRRLSTNLGAVVANSGRIKAVAKTKANWSAQLRLNRRKPTRPSHPVSFTCLA